MKVVDRSGGFWLDIVKKRKSPQLTISSRLLPDASLMNAVATEMISSIKGGNSSTFYAFYHEGRLRYTKVSTGEYPFGIKKNVSPDGTPYELLSKSTISKRKWLSQNEGYPSERVSQRYTLRETSKHIYNKLKIIRLESKKLNYKITVGWTSDIGIVVLQNNGGIARTPFLDGEENQLAIIPARPFIGLQEKFVQTYFNLIKQLAR